MATSDDRILKNRRRPTAEEEAWIRDIVSANPKWAGVNLGDLFVADSGCKCGCRSIWIEEPENAQVPELIGHQSLVGDIDISIRYDGKDNVVSILLHYAEGSLSLLEVIWYNFPDPVPRTWPELSRTVSIGWMGEI